MGAVSEELTMPAAEMQRYILKYLMYRFEFTAMEMSPFYIPLRFDVIGINRTKRIIRIFEVKSSRQDFASDKKWHKYLPYCTHFCFAAPKGVISLNEIPSDVGLVEFERTKNGFLNHEYKRGCKNRGRLTDARYLRLIEAALMRMYEVQRENNALRQELRILKGEE